MTSKTRFVLAWRSLWQLRRRHHAPVAARLLAASLLAVALALGLMTVVAVFGRVDRPDWWRASLLPTIGICLCIVFTLTGTLRLAGLLLPARLVERLSDVRDIRAGMALSALALSGIVAGMSIGFTIVPMLAGFDLWGMFASVPVALAKFAVFLLCVMAANWAWWRSRLRRQQLRREASEARLRLLQGQIEPHLLFNTLANVQSLMDYDPPRAKRMLEAFSGYLRAGMSQLRQTDSTLRAELEMARAYLALHQIRMEDRLDYRIDACEEALAARMPALMLQPLVENAIHHGLEPKLDGGRVLVSAEVRAGRLEVRVIDDGMGIDSPSRRLRPGAGMALANLRARLQTQFGPSASLSLQAGSPGTRAVLDLPYEAAGAAARVAT
jgi:hypothetical protein